MAKLRDILKPESLTALRQAKLTLQLTADPEGIKYALEEYRKDKRAEHERPMLLRKRVENNGFSYLITLKGKPKYQTSDCVEAVLMAAGFGDRSEIHDLTGLSWIQQKLIGQFLAAKERTYQEQPDARVDPTALTAKHPDGVTRQHPERKRSIMAACNGKPKPQPDLKSRDCTPEMVKILKQLGIIEPAKPEICSECAQDPCDCLQRQQLRQALERQRERQQEQQPYQFAEVTPRYAKGVGA
jgi:hypothetical protein